LSSYKEDGLSKQTKRKHLIKRRDILNISKKYNVNIICPKVEPSKNKIKYEPIQETVEPPVIYSLPNTTESNKRHLTASQLALSFVSSIHENLWRISMGNLSVSNNNNHGVYVTKNDIVSCSSDDCKSYCNYCNICYHAYSCTCSEFISKTVICEHVHLTIRFQANQLYQNEDHIEKNIYGNQDHTKYTQKCAEPRPNTQQPIKIEIQDHTKYTQNCTGSSNLHQYIKNVNLYNHSQNNDKYKQNMKSKNLINVKTRLKKLMMGTLQKIDECNNSDLLEYLEKQITNISCNLERDLIENATNKINEVQTMLPEKNIEVYYVA